MLTVRCGLSLAERATSESGEPIVKLPANPETVFKPSTLPLFKKMHCCRHPRPRRTAIAKSPTTQVTAAKGIASTPAGHCSQSLCQSIHRCRYRYRCGCKLASSQAVSFRDEYWRLRCRHNMPGRHRYLLHLRRRVSPAQVPSVHVSL